MDKTAFATLVDQTGLKLTDDQKATLFAELLKSAGDDKDGPFALRVMARAPFGVGLSARDAFGAAARSHFFRAAQTDVRCAA